MSQVRCIWFMWISTERSPGIAAPTGAPLLLPTDPDLRAEYFTERRELGALNVGGSGCYQGERQSHTLENLDCLYIGRGNAEVSFESKDPSSPAIFYLLSYPAHTAHPVALVRKEEASPTTLGSAETCNLRTVSKYIYLGGVKSCQLVMGVTHLHAGSVWNTMPPHTHMRRSEVYLYFNLAQEAVVFHLMGPPGRDAPYRDEEICRRWFLLGGPSMPVWGRGLIAFAGDGRGESGLR